MQASLGEHLPPLSPAVAGRLPTVLPHVEGPHSGALLRAPHLQNAPSRGIDHQELSYSAGTLSVSKGGRIHLFGDSFVEVLYNLDPANLGVPIPLETKERDAN